MMASTSSGSAVNKVEKAHQLYRDGRYNEALSSYTQALSLAKTKPQKIALHSNRAACFLKLRHFKKAAEECSWVLELDQNHTGALMLRAQTLVTLRDYHSALFDVNRLIKLNPSSEVYQNLQARLRTQLSLAPIPEDEAELEEEEDELDSRIQKAAKVKENNVGERNLALERVFEQGVKAERVSPRMDSTAQSVTSGKPIEHQSSGWKQIPKPKGHSQLDYSRWDRVEDDSGDDDDEDEDHESQCQYRFRVKNIGVRAVK